MKIALIVGVWMVALVGGLLLYSAREKAESLGQPPAQAEAVAASQQTPAAATAEPGKILFSLPDLDGEARDIREWDGQHRLVNFWATWCAPCRREIPLLKAFQDEHADSNIQVIGVAVDFPEDVARYAEAAEFNYPILVGQEDAMAIAESTGLAFAALPFTMIVAADGRLISTHVGEVFADDLDELAATLAALDAGEIAFEEAQERL